MSYYENRTITTSNVHLHGGNTAVTMSFNDHSESPVPFHVLKLDAGAHTLNVFFMHHDGPNLAEVLQHIIDAATEQLEKLTVQAWTNAIEELATKVEG